MIYIYYDQRNKYKLYDEYLKLNNLRLFLFTKKSKNLTEFVLLNCTF